MAAYAVMDAKPHVWKLILSGKPLRGLLYDFQIQRICLYQREALYGYVHEWLHYTE